MRKSHHSLHGLLRRSLLRSVVCMILPAVSYTHLDVYKRQVSHGVNE